MKFNSKQFQELYDTFERMFQEEGDVYGTLIESIESDYKNGLIHTSVNKKVALQVLDLAAVEYFKHTLPIISEEELIKHFNLT